MKHITTLLLCLSVGLGLAACQPRLTGENIAKIKNGMSIEEVEGILGQPASVETTELPLLSTTKYGYVQGDDHLTLIFVNDKLISKSGSIGAGDAGNDESNN